MDTLLDTVRGEIAACIEKAYLCISCTEAARRLNLPSQQAVLEYGKKVFFLIFIVTLFYYSTSGKAKLVLKHSIFQTFCLSLEMHYIQTMPMKKLISHIHIKRREKTKKTNATVTQ